MPSKIRYFIAFLSVIIPLITLLSSQAADLHRRGAAEMTDNQYATERDNMVRTQIERRGVTDAKVLAAMRKVARHLFVPTAYRSDSYEDRPLPISDGQTISQPYIVAIMTDKLELKGGEKVLEIGTGSGYQAAVLAEIAKSVYSIEIVPSLGESARKLLVGLGYSNIEVRIGDGYRGWPEQAPFDAIIVTAAPDHVPPKLIEQLKEGGRLVIPVGTSYQQLKVITRGPGGIHSENIFAVRFVPMTGEAEKKSAR
jgi:protein-L-isoaspartate(D-aspartate) O-methyltransferase